MSLLQQSYKCQFCWIWRGVEEFMQVWVLDSFRASSNFERGGNKTMTHTDFCKSPTSRSIHDTSHIWHWKSHRSEDNTQFSKTEKCSSWTRHQRPQRIWPDTLNPPWTQTSTLGSQLAAWPVVMPFWHPRDPDILQSSLHTKTVHVVGTTCRYRCEHSTWGPGGRLGDLWHRNVCCLSPDEMWFQAFCLIQPQNLSVWRTVGPQ